MQAQPLPVDIASVNPGNVVTKIQEQSIIQLCQVIDVAANHARVKIELTIVCGWEELKITAMVTQRPHTIK